MSTSEHKVMTTAQIRDDFLRFFEEKGCKLYPSSSLVPEDPSLLLTNAGMNQFKEYYQGIKTMHEIGATSCQKCLRTNDIDNIGDSRHLSFFEMLGNFSFGGYSKADAIAWAWEFVTAPEHLGLPADRLYMTVYEKDDEAEELWLKQGVAADHISRLGEEDNFWAAGPTGPCGPCSEIYFDQGPEFEGDAPGDDGDRYLEFWNLVFTQYDRQEDGSMPELPHRNIDTGMGLERIAAIMQHQHTNYEGDVLRSLIGVGERLSHKSYGSDEAVDRSLRIVADHSRAVTFMIGDGILPSNDGRGYVLRRLLRRAVYHGRLLGISGAFLVSYTHEVARLLGDVYSELVEQQALIDGIISAEEEHFSATLDAGEAILERELTKLGRDEVLPGSVAFRLHDTYGFPIDLTREIGEAQGHHIDMDGFNAAMENQRDRARAAAHRDAWSAASSVWVGLSDRLSETKFVGYDQDSLENTQVVALVSHEEEVYEVCAGSDVEVVLEATPFYGEMGGQVGDSGYLKTEDGVVRVHDTKHHEGGLVAHICTVEEGTLHVGSKVSATIDHERRELIRRNHTATHLLDAALRKVLGDHVSQAGSLVAPDKLRFDFTHFEALSTDQLERIEGMINAEIFAAKPVVTQIMGLEEAKAAGAIALFGEKYGDVVRVVSVGTEEPPFSRELCGGTHARNSADLGLFKIISESSSGANVRRIEAVTSAGALSYVDENLQILAEAAATLKVKPTDLPKRISALLAELAEERKKLREAKTQVSAAERTSVELEGYTCVFSKLAGVGGRDLRSVWDSIRDTAERPEIACVLVSKTSEGKVALLAAASDSAVAAGFDAGKLIREIAVLVGGRGGGKPAMAQAGGSDASGIDAALAKARELLGA